MIDTHTHLYMSDAFPDGGKEAVAHAVEAGVEMMILPGVDLESVEPMLALHESFPSNTAVAPGLHPTEVEKNWRQELDEILSLSSGAEWVAIGETGLDLHWDKSNFILQMDSFGEQLDIALSRNLPVIVHSRDALNETVELLRQFGQRLPQIIFHSFTADVAAAGLLLETAPEAVFGINGVVTFKNASELREAVKFIGVDRIMTETDSPYLAPVPYRGKTNESSLIPYIVRGLASTLEMPEEEVAEATSRLARSVFFPNR